MGTYSGDAGMKAPQVRAASVPASATFLGAFVGRYDYGVRTGQLRKSCPSRGVTQSSVLCALRCRQMRSSGSCEVITMLGSFIQLETNKEGDPADGGVSCNLPLVKLKAVHWQEGVSRIEACLVHF